MWRFPTAVLFILMFCVVHLDMLNAQDNGLATIEGRVVDAETGAPLQGAHLFLSGSKIGTATDRFGRYRLDRVPPGAHRLIISKVGYGRAATDTLIASRRYYTMNFSLETVVYDMEHLLVEYDEDWEDDLERFHRLFIGETVFADSAEIVNPRVLRFESRWWGRFTAEASQPLIIENRALGYRVTYYLDEFRHSGTITRWDGDPLFEEMTPRDSVQVREWEENRAKAFYGSLRHFLLSLVHGRARDEGFVMYQTPRDTHGISMRNQFRTSGSRLVNPAEEEDFFNFNFSGRLKIIYTEAEEDERYVRWSRDLYRAPARTQTSYLELNERPITIDMDGVISETYGATRFGHFSFRRMADRTPREYRPENW